MVIRPRTKSRIRLKLRRCNKCGAMLGVRKRCKKCSLAQ